MYLLHDQLLPHPPPLDATNRGFRYNDGFFETILFVDGQPRCWPQHWARIRRGADVLCLAFPADIETRLPELLTELVHANHLTTGPARVRWQCWRTGAGLYAPQTNAATWLATAEPAAQHPDNVTTGGRAAFAQTVRTAPSVLSFLKGPNAALYTLAALERQDRGLDDLILLSPDGYVAEAIAAAVLWVKDDTLYAPDAARTGAVAGVRLANLLEKATAAGRRIQSGCFPPEELLQADAVATVNVAGVRWLAEVEGGKLAKTHILSE